MSDPRRAARRSFAIASLVVAVAIACSPAPDGHSTQQQPPDGFPDLSAFTEETRPDYTTGSTGFSTAEQIQCTLDFGPEKTIGCSGRIPAPRGTTSAAACLGVGKPDPKIEDSAYTFSDRECVTPRRPQIGTGRRITAENGTCVIGENGLVACIDADNKHGFVLESSGSWAF